MIQIIMGENNDNHFFYLVYMDEIGSNHQLVGLHTTMENALNRVNASINNIVQFENLLNPIIENTINEPEYRRIDLFTDNHRFLIGFEIRRIQNDG